MWLLSWAKDSWWTTWKHTNLVNEIHEGSCQLNFIPKRSFILVSLIFLCCKLTKIFTAFAISLPNFVKSPGEEVRKTLVLNQTHWTKPPNTWLLGKDASLKTYFLHHSLILSASMTLHDRSLNDQINSMKWITINRVFQLFITSHLSKKAEQLPPRCTGDETGSRTAKKEQTLLSTAQKFTNLSNIIR